MTRRAAVLDTVPAPAATIRGDGSIEMVNDAWRSFAESNGRSEFLSDTERSYAEWIDSEDPGARAAADGVFAVIDGHVGSFCLVYPCHGPDEERWFEFIVVPLEHPAPRAVLSIHMPVGVDTAERLARSADAATSSMAGQIVVCAWCGARELGIGGDWVEHHAAHHADDLISHGMCPDCLTSFR